MMQLAITLIFMVASRIDNIESFICPTNSHKFCKIIIKTCKIIKGAPTCFGLRKPSSGSYTESTYNNFFWRFADRASQYIDLSN